MYGAMEESTPAEAPALGPAELKAVRKLLATNGDDARSTGLSQASLCNDVSAAAARELRCGKHRRMPRGRRCRRRLLH